MKGRFWAENMVENAQEATAVEAYLEGVARTAIQLLGRSLTHYRVFEMACAGLKPGEIEPSELDTAFRKKYPEFTPDKFAQRNMARALARLYHKVG